MSFVANFIRFPAVRKFWKSVIFDKATESLNVGTFLRHSVENLAIDDVLPFATEGRPTGCHC